MATPVISYLTKYMGVFFKDDDDMLKFFLWLMAIIYTVAVIGLWEIVVKPLGMLIVNNFHFKLPF